VSARFAIPATTFVLKGLIERDLKAAYSPLTAPTVSIAPPPRPPAPAASSGGGAPAAEREATALYLYMHHVAPNAAYRSMAVPYVETDLSQSVRHPLVLDLHYLLAATGPGLERETLLGVAMTALHRSPIVSRADVFAILDLPVPSTPTQLMDLLPDEPLWDVGQHPESIKISQHGLDIDMSTKLWSALQSPIRPSAYYLVTTTFLDTAVSTPDGPPVEEMNLTGKATTNLLDEDADSITLTHLDPLP
jgi:Pvc16 N-terminal domain